MAALDQVWHQRTRDGLAAKSFRVARTASRIRNREESTGFSGLRHRHARACPTAVWHGVCLSCRLLHGSISTNISAPLRRTGFVWSEVKSGLLWLGGWGGLEKFSDRAPMHQVGSDEAGEGEWACDDFIGVMSQTQQLKGDQRDRDLNANGVFGSSQEVADFQGLLEPSKEQLDGPSTLVQVGDVLRACLKIIGEDA